MRFLATILLFVVVFGSPGTNVKLHVPHATVLCLIEDVLKEKTELFFRE
jgi:hypothetical protein